MSATAPALRPATAAPSRLFWVSLAVYVWVLPVSHTIVLRYLAFAGLIAATAWLCLQQRRRPEAPLALPIAAYAAVALASLAWAVDPAYSLGEIKTEILYGFLVLAIAATWGRAAGILPGLAVLALAGNVVMTFVTFHNSWRAWPGLPATTSLNAGPGTYSTYVVTVLPLLGLLAWRWGRSGRRVAAGAVWLLVALNVLALLLSLNRQGLVALAAMGLVPAAALMAGGSRRRLAAILAALALLSGMLLMQLAWRGYTLSRLPAIVQQDDRWALWSFSVDRIAERPWTGGGFGRRAFDKLYPAYNERDPLLWHAHNMVLNKGVQMGVPGMAAFLLLWLALLRRFAGALREPALRGLALAGVSLWLAVFVKNMTDDFFVRDGALLFWLVAGALLGEMARVRAGQAPVRRHMRAAERRDSFPGRRKGRRGDGGQA